MRRIFLNFPIGVLLGALICAPAQAGPDAADACGAAGQASCLSEKDSAHAYLPETYGATGDGDPAHASVNDVAFARISKALGDVGYTQKSTNSVVWLRPGAVYRTTRPVLFQQYNVILVGNGAAIWNGGAGPALQIDHANSVNSNQHTWIDNLVLQTATTSAANHALLAQSTDFLKLSRIKVMDMSSSGIAAAGGDGIRLNGAIGASIENCFVGRSREAGRSVNGVGINIQPYAHQNGLGDAATYVNFNNDHVVIDSNRVYNAGAQGILVTQTMSPFVHRNDVESSGLSNYEIQNATSFDVTSNYSEVPGVADLRIGNDGKKPLQWSGGLIDIVAGLVAENMFQGADSIELAGGAGVIFRDNWLSGKVTISRVVRDTVWYPQRRQFGAFADGGANTLRLDTLLPALAKKSPGDRPVAEIPAVTSGFCDGPTIIAARGAYAFAIKTGASCRNGAGVLAMPAAPNGWVCDFTDTTGAATHAIVQTGGDANSVSLQDFSRATGAIQPMSAGDVVRGKCEPY